MPLSSTRKRLKGSRRNDRAPACNEALEGVCEGLEENMKTPVDLGGSSKKQVGPGHSVCGDFMNELARGLASKLG
jgi:hypothetical protein